MNYEPLIERDLDAIPAAAHAFLESHTAEELWTSVTRFAVLAYAPSQHLKRAVMACHATWVLRESIDFVEMIIECARYASEARQPWSEPPILEPPPPSSAAVDELLAAARSGDLVRAEAWLSAALPEAHNTLRDVVRGDARLMLDTALALEPLLGEKGRYALLRMPIWELIADPDAADPSETCEALIARAVADHGSPDSVREALLECGGPAAAFRPDLELRPYHLARDYAQTLLVHALAPFPQLIAAVHDNLEHGESFADWSLA